MNGTLWQKGHDPNYSVQCKREASRMVSTPCNSHCDQRHLAPELFALLVKCKERTGA